LRLRSKLADDVFKELREPSMGPTPAAVGAGALHAAEGPRQPERAPSGETARDEPLHPRGLPRWTEWKRLLDGGVYANRAELARAEGVSRAAVTLGLRRLARLPR
jgi:hypothetical protein